MPGTKNSGGHNKKSRQMHIVTGTFRKDRHGDDDAPEPPSGDPVPPTALTGHAADEWKRMVERLRVSRTLSVVDDGALYQYCQLFAETEQIKADADALRVLADKLEERVNGQLEDDQLFEAVQEIVKLHLLISKATVALRQGHMALRQYLVEFGMTPSARTRVKVPSDGKQPTAAELARKKYFGGAARK